MKSYPKVKNYTKYSISRRAPLILLSKELPRVPIRKGTAGRVDRAYNMWENGDFKYVYCLPNSYRKIDKDVYGNNDYTRRLGVVSKNRSKLYYDRP